MDSLSHALIGIAVAGLSGHQLSLNDPIYLATILGAQAPDFDIITQIKGNFSYIKQHRSFSHSLPGLAIWSLLIGILLHFFMPQTHLLSLLGWAFAGGLSHIMIDYFNTHGAAILWPFRKERKSLYLLNVVDPILLVLMTSLYSLNITMFELSFSTFFVIIAYLALRIILRKKAKKQLKNLFDHQKIIQLSVMPSLKRILFWDFVLETEHCYLVGQLGVLYPVLEINANLPKQKKLSKITLEARKTPLGDFFTSFTPFIYFEEREHFNTLSVNIYDLRYILNKQFLHHATIIFDHNKLPTASYMHSYGRTMKIPC
ncbi:metal-dependent hydrolase [Pelosinus sp. sgz500959]|uniref:metal-dependent hydrolase n=1 Tax=Pelosinus sp. sgz500959 TaxID=3242472 RepID=UPI00366EB348